jgi:hypothetical protein
MFFRAVLRENSIELAMIELLSVPLYRLPGSVRHRVEYASPTAPALSLKLITNVGLQVRFVRERFPGENRVAMTPAALPVLKKAGVEWIMEAGAGVRAGFPDAEYAERGVRILEAWAAVFAAADAILQVRGLCANPETGAGDLALLRRGQTLLGFGEPLTALAAAPALA